MIVENRPDLKYRYAMYTWGGGFYNKEYKEIHKEEEGQRIFDTLDEREKYIKYLKDFEESLNARSLMIVLDEGFVVEIPLVMHRVIKLNEKLYYSEQTVNVWATNEEDTFRTASYHIENKWYPGFNDYPAGEDVDYSQAEIIQEWITGAFKPEY